LGLLTGLGLCDRKLVPAVLAVDGVCWVAGFAAGAESFQGLWSWDGEGLVRAGVQVELVSALALVPCYMVGFEFPFPLGRCLYCAAAPWTVQSHRMSSLETVVLSCCFWIFKNGFCPAGLVSLLL